MERDFDKENETIYFYITGISAFFFAVGLFIFHKPWRDNGCIRNEHYYLEKFNGNVKEKWNDKSSGRPRPMIKFQNGEDIPFWRKYYKEVSIGDSIYKPLESFELHIVKNDTHLILPYKVPCFEEGYLQYLVPR